MTTQDEATMPATFQLDPVMTKLPKLPELPVEISEGRWSGCSLRLGPNNTFDGTLPSFEKFITLTSELDAKEGRIEGTTPLGPVVLKRVIPLSLNSSGKCRGHIGEIALTHAPISDGPLLLRHFRLNPTSKVGDLQLPEPVEYQGTNHFFSAATFQLLGRPVRIVQIPDGTGFMYELEVSELEYRDNLETIETHLHHIDRLFHLFFGQEWGEEFARQICDPTTGDPLVTEWVRVVPRTSSGYAVIPADYFGLNLAREKFKELGPYLVLNFERFAPCIEGLVQDPDLIVPIDLIVQTNDLSMNTRGILLSVALESLTELIRKRKGISVESLIPEEIWPAFKSGVEGVISNLPPLHEDASIDLENRDTLVYRLEDLNRPTNNQKLKKPFDMYAIPLAPKDMQAISRRNPALHQGRLKPRVPVVEANSKYWKEVDAIERRLMFAVTRLLLKYLNYSGPVLDWTSEEGSPFPPGCVLL